jgi:hypothetical protein
MARVATSTSEDSVWPYFFLSHAHPPGSRNGSKRKSGPKKLVQRLFDALCDHLGEICPSNGETPMGMMDSRIAVGEDWDTWLSYQLSVCRAFLPLLSPGYFASEMCGKEWAAFAERKTWPRATGPDSGAAQGRAIIPVLWAPMPLDEMPPPARRLQFNEGSFPESYHEMGLYGLMARPKMKRDCQESVYLLAERIRDVARQTVIEEGRRPSLTTVTSIFVESRKPPRIHLAEPPEPPAERRTAATD